MIPTTLLCSQTKQERKFHKKQSSISAHFPQWIYLLDKNNHKFTEWLRWEGSNPAESQISYSKTMSSCILKISDDVNSTVSLQPGSVFNHHPAIKGIFLLFKWIFLYLSLCPLIFVCGWMPLRRAWLHQIRDIIPLCLLFSS